jgi:hypothetical protein
LFMFHLRLRCRVQRDGRDGHLHVAHGVQVLLQALAIVGAERRAGHQVLDLGSQHVVDAGAPERQGSLGRRSVRRHAHHALVGLERALLGGARLLGPDVRKEAGIVVAGSVVGSPPGAQGERIAARWIALAGDPVVDRFTVRQRCVAAAHDLGRGETHVVSRLVIAAGAAVGLVDAAHHQEAGGVVRQHPDGALALRVVGLQRFLGQRSGLGRPEHLDLARPAGIRHRHAVGAHHEQGELQRGGGGSGLASGRCVEQGKTEGDPTGPSQEPTA